MFQFALVDVVPMVAFVWQQIYVCVQLCDTHINFAHLCFTSYKMDVVLTVTITCHRLCWLKPRSVRRQNAHFKLMEKKSCPSLDLVQTPLLNKMPILLQKRLKHMLIIYFSLLWWMWYRWWLLCGNRFMSVSTWVYWCELRNFYSRYCR